MSTKFMTIYNSAFAGWSVANMLTAIRDVGEKGWGWIVFYIVSAIFFGIMVRLSLHLERNARLIEDVEAKADAVIDFMADDVKFHDGLLADLKKVRRFPWSKPNA